MSIADRLRLQLDVDALSDWNVVDQAMIDEFAKATHDFQFIHVDPERAKNTPFGGTIAHGFLILSLLPVLREQARPGNLDGIGMEVNYGSNKLRFLAPVRSGKRVRGRFRLIDMVEKRPGQFVLTDQCSVEIEDEETPALVFEWMTQVRTE